MSHDEVGEAEGVKVYASGTHCPVEERASCIVMFSVFVQPVLISVIVRL